MRIRRLRILGVAMALSALAALVGVVCYLAPKEQFATVNRLADFVVINDTTFWLRDGPLGKIVRFPNYDSENEHLRLIARDEYEDENRDFTPWLNNWKPIIERLGGEPPRAAAAHS